MDLILILLIFHLIKRLVVGVEFLFLSAKQLISDVYTLRLAPPIRYGIEDATLYGSQGCLYLCYSSDMYSSINMSKEEIKIFATWPHLRLVLLKSDGLHETVKGLKEASVAWRELISVIKGELSSKTEGDGDNDSSTNEVEVFCSKRSRKQFKALKQHTVAGKFLEKA